MRKIPVEKKLKQTGIFIALRKKLEKAIIQMKKLRFSHF